jgi:hypothetical protein
MATSGWCNGAVDGVFAISRFGNNSPARVTFNDASEAEAHHRVVISDQDAGHGRLAMAASQHCAQAAPASPTHMVAKVTAGEATAIQLSNGMECCMH